MNTLIQQYDVIVHQRKRLSYYRLACFWVMYGVTIHYSFSKIEEQSDVNVLLAMGHAFGLMILLLLIETVIIPCVTHSYMQRIKREMAQLYDSVNQLCSERSLNRKARLSSIGGTGAENILT